MGDTSKTIDQATTSGSRTIERAGPQVRQAAAAARKELLRMAAERLGAPAEKLTVRDGVVSVVRKSIKTHFYAQLIGGKRFNVKYSSRRARQRSQIGPGREGQGSKGNTPPSANPCRASICRPKSPAKRFTFTTCGYPACSMAVSFDRRRLALRPLASTKARLNKFPVCKVVREGKLRRRRCKNRMGGDASRGKAPGHLVATEIYAARKLRRALHLLEEHQELYHAKGRRER